ncbi:MAG: molecular chaperone TorD family protein [Ectothiorhodospiraceae bacterium]|nr:molecular chaperone TorD family protein [Ectothiorhodospiraceae bacterium]
MTELAFDTRTDDTSPRAFARAELYLCLGQALMPPVQPGTRQAMVRDLVADLEDLLPGHQAGEKLREALEAVADDTALLRAYSHLFLVPPYPAPLNAGLYIDNTIMGPSVLEMERYYQRHGLARDMSFRDTPDHLALQLQFLALLLGSAAQAGPSVEARHALEEARDFLNRFLRPWPNAWVKKLDKACHIIPECQPYAVLGRLVRDALDVDARWLQERVPAPGPAADAEEAEGTTTALQTEVDQTECGRCGKPFVPSRELAGMLRALRDQGLDAEHLTVCTECRTSAMGLSPLSPDFKEVRQRSGQER